MRPQQRCARGRGHGEFVLWERRTINLLGEGMAGRSRPYATHQQHHSLKLDSTDIQLRKLIGLHEGSVIRGWLRWISRCTHTRMCVCVCFIN